MNFFRLPITKFISGIALGAMGVAVLVTSYYIPKTQISLSSQAVNTSGSYGTPVDRCFQLRAELKAPPGFTAKWSCSADIDEGPSVDRPCKQAGCTDDGCRHNLALSSVDENTNVQGSINNCSCWNDNGGRNICATLDNYDEIVAKIDALRAQGTFCELRRTPEPMCPGNSGPGGYLAVEVICTEPSPTPSLSPTITLSPTASPLPTRSPTQPPVSFTLAPSEVPPTLTVAPPTRTPTNEPTVTLTRIPTNTLSPTASPSFTPTNSPIPTFTITPTTPPSLTPFISLTMAPVATFTSAPGVTITIFPTAPVVTIPPGESFRCEPSCGLCGWRDTAGACHNNSAMPDGTLCCHRECVARSCQMQNGKGSDKCTLDTECFSPSITAPVQATPNAEPTLKQAGIFEPMYFLILVPVVLLIGIGLLL